jgi:hypothetical protein
VPPRLRAARPPLRAAADNPATMRQVLAPMRLLGRREPLALMPFVFTR